MELRQIVTTHHGKATEKTHSFVTEMLEKLLYEGTIDTYLAHHA